MNELLATRQLMERHESVVQGATDRREVPSSFDKHQSEEVKRADPQRVNSHSIVREPRDVATTKENDLIYVADTSNQDEV